LCKLRELKALGFSTVDKNSNFCTAIRYFGFLVADSRLPIQIGQHCTKNIA